MTVTNNNLTPSNSANEPQVYAMLGKAVLAYADWMDAEDAEDEDMYGGDITPNEMAYMKYGEYVATVRCVEMLVNESVEEIEMLVMERYAEKQGVC